MPGSDRLDALLSQLGQLGKHKIGKYRSHIKRLAELDLTVLKMIIEGSVRAMAPKRITLSKRSFLRKGRDVVNWPVQQKAPRGALFSPAPKVPVCAYALIKQLTELENFLVRNSSLLWDSLATDEP